MPYRLKRGAPREEEEVRQFGVKIKGRDVDGAFSRRRAIWKRLGSRGSIRADLKECGKVTKSHFGTLVSEAGALGAVNYFQCSATPGAHMPYFYGGDH